jgi:hypothetical protein
VDAKPLFFFFGSHTSYLLPFPLLDSINNFMKFHLESLGEDYPEHYQQIVDESGCARASLLGTIVALGESRYSIEFLRAIIDAVDAAEGGKNEN